MIHAFLLIVLIGGVDVNRKTPMFFRNINDCLYFAKQSAKQYGNYEFSYLIPEKHRVTAYCKPVYIREDTATLY